MSGPSKYDTNWFTDSDELGKKKSGLGVRNGPAVTQAVAAIDAFARRNGNAWWPKLDRKTVASDLVQRILEPDKMDQGGTWLCGIATVARTYAFDFPLEYARMAIELFETGQSRMAGRGKYAGKAIRPSKTLRKSAPADRVSQGDWLVLASIREAFNDVFDYSSDEGIFRIKAWNFPSDVVKEFRALGYSKIVDKANGLKAAGYYELVQASELYQQDWRVILLVNSRILNSEPRKDGSDGGDLGAPALFNTSNHWIGLDSDIVISTFNDRPMVQPFRVYSWNTIYSIPRWNKPLPLQTVIDSFFGFVAGLH